MTNCRHAISYNQAGELWLRPGINPGHARTRSQMQAPPVCTLLWTENFSTGTPLAVRRPISAARFSFATAFMASV